MRRWLFALVLLAHGGIHLMGFVDITGIGSVEGISGSPTFLLDRYAPGDPVLVAFGALWLVPFIGFVAAAIGLATRQRWWTLTAVAAAVVSLGLTLLWWSDARYGVLVNLLVIGIILALNARPRAVAS